MNIDTGARVDLRAILYFPPTVLIFVSGERNVLVGCSLLGYVQSAEMCVPV